MRPKVRVAVATVAVGMLVALSACSSTGATLAVPPKPTTNQVRVIMQRWAGQQGTLYNGHLLGSQFSFSFVRFVPDSTRQSVLASCVSRLGGTFGYKPSYARVGTPVTSADAARTEYANAACSIAYPSASLKKLVRTPAELDYTYAYYANSLVPCLRAAGMQISGMPTASQFRTFSGSGLTAWSPYGALSARISPAPARAVLESRCPPSPPGMSG